MVEDDLSISEIKSIKIVEDVALEAKEEGVGHHERIGEESTKNLIREEKEGTDDQE